MRKYQQRKILELLKTLEEAQSAGLYADCQDGARFIGEYIENAKGEGTQTVMLLEEYCELLFKAYKGEIREKILRKHLIKIENSVKLELKPDRVEMVFLSYKASMSDSIESIYLAARADPSCDAYWIPVPYYNRKSDGSVEAMHFEGAECYSDKIECTDWRVYDIEERRPDVIFTFNPYDGQNYVTSVHPNFYCERLRNLTELLVYIPYFVCVEDVQEHFCTTAGCVYAHMVVIQSEKIRRIYIRAFKKVYGNRFGNPEDKFIVLGSPKYDRILQIRREDYELPKVWEKRIEKKKVILYNTTIGALLVNTEQYLKKLRYALSVFKEHSDIALWWRPHPLSEATFLSMCPQYFNEYVQIVADYRHGDWGIYDDSPDLHRALAWSDAYYGDGSSVVAMYQVMGKAIMIQSLDTDDSKITLNPLFAFFVNDGNNLWFTSEMYNALLKMNVDTWQVEFIGGFPNELSCPILYRKPVIHNGNIFFPPCNAKEIAVYSICDKKFTKIAYYNSEIGESCEMAFCRAVIYGEYVYFVPYKYPAIMCLNISTNEITFFSEWLAPLKELIGDVQDLFFISPIAVGSLLMLPACGADAVVEFNMETHQSVIHEICKKGYRYNGICFDGENYWLSPRCNTPVVKWNAQTGEVKEFVELVCDINDIENAYLPIIFCDGHVWMLNAQAKYAVKIDVHTDAITIAEEFSRQDDSEWPQSKYYFSQISDNSIFTFNSSNGMLIEYDCKTKEMRKQSIQYPTELMAQIEFLFVKTLPFANLNMMKTVYDCYCYENSTVRLSSFLSYIVNGNYMEEIDLQNSRAEIALSGNAHTDGKAGQAIYNFVIKSMFG